METPFHLVPIEPLPGQLDESSRSQQVEGSKDLEEIAWSEAVQTVAPAAEKGHHHRSNHSRQKYIGGTAPSEQKRHQGESEPECDPEWTDGMWPSPAVEGIAG